jgi:3-hydroxyisobutyrate dehydrogenase
VPAAAKGARIVFSMIPDDAALRAVALGDAGVLAALEPRAIYVDLSTVSPQASSEVAVEAAKRGVDYLRAPVSGSTVLAEAGKLTVMASGPPGAFEACRPYFSVLAAKAHHVGDADQARYLKLVVNMLVAATAVVMGEALTLGRKGGLDWRTMLAVIGESAAASPLVGYKLDPLKTRDFSPAFSVEQMIKDMTLVMDAAEAAGVPAEIARHVRELYLEMAAAGEGGLDFFAAVKQIERKAGLGEL